MIITLHILIALASITLTTAALIRPSRQLLRVNYSFIGLTVASGTYLTIIAPAHMVETCTVGLGYLVVVTLGTVLARVKLGKLVAEGVRAE